jgi:aspartyl-tRNA(Asn)/glutamyl-tRNA(Gln) amidotransferase subunit C
MTAMAIERSYLKKIAELARLELSEEEATRLTRDCQAILEYFEAIRQIDSEADASEGVERSAPLRQDIVDCDPLEDPLRDLAPLWRDGYFVLPRLPAMDADGFEDGS